MKRPLDIVLEVGLNADAPRGIDYYMANLVSALAEADRVNRYCVFSYFFRDYARKRARLPVPDQPNFTAMIRRFPERLVHLLERDWRLPLTEPLLLRGRGPDIYHKLGGGLIPRLRRGKVIATFFDLSDPKGARFAREADCLVATGENTKRALVRHYAAPPEKIAVIPTGVNLKVFQPVADPVILENVRRRYKLPRQFVMTIGPYVPDRRVNADIVLRAFASLRRAGDIADCRLVLAGSPGSGGRPALDRLGALSKELGIADAVSETGFIALEDLPAVYAQSLAVIHPTSVEGYGFGLEIMACGALLITSNLPGVVEAVGGDALTVPPGEVEPLRQAIKAAHSRPELRRGLINRGLLRARNQGYEKIAERFLELYERLSR